MSLRRLLCAAPALGLALLLAACATPPGDAARDVTTASDQTDTARRAQLRMELASGYFARGQATTALDEVKQALALDPNLAQAYNLRGLIYAGMGEERLADESFRHALQLNGRDADTLHNYGWFLCQQRHYAEAAPLFAQALAAPQYRDAQRTLLAQGVCQARAGSNAEAERSLMRAYELDPTNPVVAVNLSEVLLRRGEYERARFYVRRVNGNADFVSAQTLWLAARIERRLGNAQGLREFGTQLRNRFPQSPEALAYENGRFDE